MNCPRCGRENDPSNQFCGRCGLEFAQVSTAPHDAADVMYCYRHPKEPTRLSCGRCGRPICTRCVVIGPAGPRCRECAKQNVPISARGVAHDVASSVRGIGRLGPFGIYYMIILGLMVLGFVRGCLWHPQQVPTPDQPPVEQGAPTNQRV